MKACNITKLLNVFSFLNKIEDKLGQ